MANPSGRVKPLKDAAVVCEHPECTVPASYLVSQTYPQWTVGAYCEKHALERAVKLRLPLPMGKERLGGLTKAGAA